jgi:hypothetical protein
VSDNPHLRAPANAHGVQLCLAEAPRPVVTLHIPPPILAVTPSCGDWVKKSNLFNSLPSNLFNSLCQLQLRIRGHYPDLQDSPTFSSTPSCRQPHSHGALCRSRTKAALIMGIGGSPVSYMKRKFSPGSPRIASAKRTKKPGLRISSLPQVN